MRDDNTPKDRAQDAEDDAKIIKALILFERYVQAIVNAAPPGSMHPAQALDEIRSEVVTFIKEVNEL